MHVAIRDKKACVMNTVLDKQIDYTGCMKAGTHTLTHSFLPIKMWTREERVSVLPDDLSLAGSSDIIFTEVTACNNIRAVNWIH